MQVMEKGTWDEVFPINGGGHVHMKLQFILNEEERNRIRVVVLIQQCFLVLYVFYIEEI